MGSSQDKTEDPTPKRLREARERGQIPRSQDLTTGMMLAAAVALLALTGPRAVAELEGMTLATFEQAIAVDGGGAGAAALLSIAGSAVHTGAMVLAPILLGLALAGLLFTFVQVGAIITGEPLMPKLERMNPIEGLKRMFFSMNAWVELLKSVLKLVIIGAIAWVVVSGNLGLLLTSQRLPLLAGAAIAGEVVLQLAKWTIGGVFALGVIDLFYQRWSHNKELRMSREEIKEEYKSMEGDPQHKAKRRRAHREAVERGVVQQVAKAHMVVTNPTHYACALRYDPDEEGAPRLLVKGQDHVAHGMVEMAKDLKIPVVRDVGLARALWELEEEEEVPEELYDAAAELMRGLAELAHAEGRLMPWEPEAPK